MKYMVSPIFRNTLPPTHPAYALLESLSKLNGVYEIEVDCFGNVTTIFNETTAFSLPTYMIGNTVFKNPILTQTEAMACLVESPSTSNMQQPTQRASRDDVMMQVVLTVFGGVINKDNLSVLMKYGFDELVCMLNEYNNRVAVMEPTTKREVLQQQKKKIQDEVIELQKKQKLVQKELDAWCTFESTYKNNTAEFARKWGIVL